jgi:hypothetical protein
VGEGRVQCPDLRRAQATLDDDAAITEFFSKQEGASPRLTHTLAAVYPSW